VALLRVSNLEVGFDTREGVVKAVNGVSFEVKQGETLAIVGESGSGKSQMVLSFMGLLAENGHVRGEAFFRGEDLLKMKPRDLNRIRGKHIAMIFQDPMTSLNPFLTIERQMSEVVMHHQGLGRDEARSHAIEMLRAVRIPDPEERIQQYPHEYSGGMRQRVMIAIGLLCEPDLLIADEPSTALDVTVQAQITELVSEKKIKVVLLVDEASLLRLEVFAELHTICQFEKDSKPYLPMILAGQNSLIDKLTYRSSQPLASRIVARSHLQGSDLAGMQDYLKHHLSIAGIKQNLFDQNAITAIHQGSGGLFRKANHLARGALIAAAANQATLVNADHVRLASTEIF